MNRLIERVEAEGSPVVEGELVTFVWKGAHPPKIMGDFTDWEQGEPLNLEKNGENAWSRSIHFPLNAYLEYVFIRDGKRVIDPNNPNITPNGFGRYNNYFYMPDYKPTALVTPCRESLRGSVNTQLVPTWDLVGGNNRKVHFYSPPVTNPTPLLVVMDGQDYLRRAHLPVIIDNLIAQKRIKPVSLALVENSRGTRMVEYACSEGNLIFLSEVVLPIAREKLYLIDLSEFPGAFGILGASMGGLMALYAGLRLPEIFGKVLIQSGGFSFGNRDMVVFDLVKYVKKKSIRIWMEIGKYDIQTLLSSNKRMIELLHAQEYDVIYREYNAGHNYPAWRDEIWRGLEYFFAI